MAGRSVVRSVAERQRLHAGRLLLSRFLVGAAIATVGLLAAAFLFGPLARHVLGNPLGWHEDFTSRGAIFEAALSQVLGMTAACFATGAIWSAFKRSAESLDLHPAQIANAFSTAFGFFTCRMLMMHTQAEAPSLLNGLLLIGLSPFIFPIALTAGANMISTRKIQPTEKASASFAHLLTRLYYGFCLLIVAMVFLKCWNIP